MRATADSVRAVNRLTSRWAATAGPDDTVFSATGVWPLLARLADAADGPARAELEDAVGMRGDHAADAARRLLAALATVRGSRSAIGLWVRRVLPLRPEWTAGVPADCLSVLSGDSDSDRRTLDTWASENTDGLIRSMPIKLDDAVLLVLAAAQVVRLKWLRPFRDSGMTPETGPWQGRELLALCRSTSLLDRIGVAGTDHGPLTVLKVLGDTGVDVHLLLGAPDMAPGDVLQAGIGTLTGTYRIVPGDRLPFGGPGPGLTVGTVRSRTPDPTLAVLTSPFRLSADHDLLHRPALFGLSTAMDGSHGHFPRMSAAPLAVASARQSATAVFDAEGFEAASVTAIGAMVGGLGPPPRHTTKYIEAEFDRPFGFLAVHRTSRLVLTAGWVAEPTPCPEFDSEPAS
ncbi:serpin family protein [Streptomyces sp. NPDC006678]|uniref:serpin family protein n=1 Tax=Streptomyces sp. NPDC006678 TaxID=3157185 RepID=UPI0033F95BD3